MAFFIPIKNSSVNWPGQYIKSEIEPAFLGKIIMTSMSHDALQDLENDAFIPNFQIQQENKARFWIPIISVLKQSAVFIQSPHEETSRQTTVVPMAIKRKGTHPATVFSNELGNK